MNASHLTIRRAVESAEELRYLNAVVDDLTDEKALSMLDDYLDIQKKKVALKRKYVKKFKKVLTPKKLVLYYQTENKMDAIIMVELAAEVPLVK